MVAAARPPVRFFSPDAPVVDLYLGQLDQVKFKDSDLMAFTVFSFVWYFICSNCKREQMERAKRVSKAPVRCFGIVVIKLVVLCEIERVFFLHRWSVSGVWPRCPLFSSMHHGVLTLWLRDRKCSRSLRSWPNRYK